tara:strand:- start:69 stop:272 length:204 start_codon:yes stop_codon:yes gene_type:complete
MNELTYVEQAYHLALKSGTSPDDAESMVDMLRIISIGFNIPVDELIEKAMINSELRDEISSMIVQVK